MPLPVIETPKYELRLPSSNKRIQYRPYLVKEEKILMVARESNDQKQITQAIKDTISSCTFGKIDPDKLSVFDLEYIFLKLRAKSVGEVSKLTLKCEKCEKPNPLEINLEEVSVNTENLPDAKIQLTDKIGVVMNWPNVNLISELAEQDKSDTGKVVMSVIVGCIDSIFDEKVVHRASDHTPEELHQFIESLNQTQFNKIRKFIESTPKLEHKIEYKCSHCGTDNSLTLTGLQNFFS
jgi:hypothetical protein